MVGLLALAISLIGCADPNAVPEVSGRIEPSFRDRAIEAMRPDGEIRFSSMGGEADSAWEVAQMVESRKVHVQLGRNCFSACAEFFIPTPSVSASPDTLIGYHGGDFMFDALTREFFDGVSYVHPERIDWLRAAYSKQNLNQDFYKQVQRRLDIRYIGIDQLPSGPKSAIYSKVSFWFPTSAQIRTYLGMTSIGPICADDRQCWEPRLKEIAEPDEWFVVGDETIHFDAHGNMEVIHGLLPEVKIQIAPLENSRNG